MDVCVYMRLFRNVLLLGSLLSMIVGSVSSFYPNFKDEDYFTGLFARYHNNRPDATWKATTDNFNHNDDMEQYWKHSGGGYMSTEPEDRLPVKHIQVGQLPESFDPRVQWPECPSLTEIRSQGSCGSCWAFGAVEAATDRICIQSKGKLQYHLSAQDVTSCCRHCGINSADFSGCGGGYINRAWRYLRDSGAVTGGARATGEGCYPYEFWGSVPGQLAHTIPTTPPCKYECRPGYNKTWMADKHYAESVYVVKGLKQMQWEIMSHGPVEACFAVYGDFHAYKSGIYQRSPKAKHIFDHCVKMMGWGTENGTDYWIAANSWNEHWGERGFFRILRGTNECGIENEVMAGIMKL